MGLDRSEPGRLGPASHPRPSDHHGYLAGGRGQGDSRGRRPQRCPGVYLWLVVVTGVRRGELCGLQIRDVRHYADPVPEVDRRTGGHAGG